MSRKILLVISVLLFITVNAQDIPTGYSKVKELKGIEEYKLESNGLTVLLMEDHSTPVLTFMVTYMVGSRNEVTGTTGATHILEHLMFKDTKNFQKKDNNSIDAILSEVGAINNASTWYDRTNYFESIPSDKLDLAVMVESERMRNLLLREEDKNSEMTVVRNEFEMGENSPYESLDKLIWATAYVAHPYHHSTIGWRSDIENVPIQKLREFYNTFYWPDNAVVTIIGDFQKQNALDIVKKYYGPITKAPNPIPNIYTTEPEQQGARKVVLKRPGELAVLGIGHKTPEGLSKGTYALTVLNYILSDGKTSRFYKSITDKNLAVELFVSYIPFKDNNLFVPYVFLAPGVKHEDVEKIILDEYAKIKKEGVTPEEVTRAINKINAETEYGRDGSFSIAAQINEAIAMGDWAYFANYTDNISKVTPKDVQDVVDKYFNEDQSTTGYFYPIGGDTSEMGMLEGNNLNTIKMNMKNRGLSFYKDPSRSLLDNQISKNVTRTKIEGIDVITSKMGVNNVITFKASFAAGDVFSPETNTMVADLTGQMLDKGTTKNNMFELAQKIENLGITLAFTVDNLSLNVSGRCLKKDINEVMGLLAEQLRYPAFNNEELEKVKKRRIGSFKQMLEEPSYLAENTMNQLIFPKGHPNYNYPADKSLEDINKVSLDDIKNFYNKYYGPKSMALVAAGDIDQKDFESAVSKAFNGWKGGIDYPSFNKNTMPVKPVKKYVSMPGKSSTVLQIGVPSTMKRTDTDYLPLKLGVNVFGGSFQARLMSTVRGDEGLTYGIYSWLSNDIFTDGQWNVQGNFAPELLEKGTTSTLRELKRWVSEGISEHELKVTKSRLIGEYKVYLATTNGMVSQILTFVQQGRDIKYLDEFPDMINALTLEQVNNAIKKYIDPEKTVIVVAGSVDEKGNPLK